jgi:hypothetical protein
MFSTATLVFGIRKCDEKCGSLSETRITIGYQQILRILPASFLSAGCASDLAWLALPRMAQVRISFEVRKLNRKHRWLVAQLSGEQSL